MDGAKRERDAYLKARHYEREAREKEKQGDHEATIELWRQYAKLKESKGSYFLCIYGYFNVARICDKLQRWREAAESFRAASTFAVKIGEFSIWALLMSLSCQMYEKEGDYEACKNTYETMGNFFYTMDNFFKAADAYEHAAEIMLLSGKDISDYEVPLKAWEKNYEYWKERGEMDDAEWSLNRITTYRSIQTRLSLKKETL